MNNFIQLLIATILSSFGIAEDVEMTSTTAGSYEIIEMTDSVAFLPVREDEWLEYDDTFYFIKDFNC